jgi:YEATS domain-containing protein 4
MAQRRIKARLIQSIIYRFHGLDAAKTQGIAVHRPIVYGNTAVFLNPSERTNPDHTHRWTVAVRSAASPPPGKRGEIQQVGGYDDLGYFIKKVSFKLHETIPNPLRGQRTWRIHLSKLTLVPRKVVDKPPFEVTETGWGEFEIQIKIYFITEANEKVLTVQHLLKLHPWTIKDGIMQAAPDIPRGPDGTPSLDVVPVHSWQYDEVVFNDPTEALYNITMQHAPTPL